MIRSHEQAIEPYRWMVPSPRDTRRVRPTSATRVELSSGRIHGAPQIKALANRYQLILPDL
jgi:hypothetical protein